MDGRQEQFQVIACIDWLEQRARQPSCLCITFVNIPLIMG